MAAELGELLAASDERAPVVLVGHSLGGINARLYAQHASNAVVGLVLVDAMHEDQEQRVQALLPEAVRRQHQEQFAANTEGLSSESLHEGLDALRRGERSLGSRPLIVLSAGLPPRPLPDVSDETAQRMWAARRALQAELVQLSSNSVQVIADRSGHAIPRDQPQLVIDATLEVVRAVRQRQPVEREFVLGGPARARERARPPRVD
jgi:pimeloyl-ACP methyl ester carboxylesterase